MSGCCSSVPAAADDAARRALAIRVAIAVFFAMMTMAIALVTYVSPFGALEPAEHRMLAWAMAMFSLPVVVGTGSVFAIEARAELKGRRPGMSTLVTLGTASAYLYSWWALVDGRSDVYFDTATMIVLFVLVGRLIESRLTGSADATLEEWLASLPPRVTRVSAGHHDDVAAAALRPGAEILVRAGDIVPLDGRVLDGRSELDRAALTGESVPVEVGPGTLVEAGTVNLSGRLHVRVTAPVGSRVVDELIRTVRACSGERPAIQRIADRFARQLVYVAVALAAVVLVVGSATIGFQPALLRALAVLVIACPCVAGLATPAAIAAASSSAARRGIVIKSADALERLARARTIVFDKTGTLTSDRISVKTVVAAAGEATETVLAWAAAVEAGVRHPIADAITAHAGHGSIPRVEDIRVVPGRGATALAESGRVLVGNERLLASHGVARHGADLDAGDGAVSWVHVAVAGRWIGALGLAAPIRRGVAEALAAVRARGLRLRISTGDCAAVAYAVGRELGLPDEAIDAELEPREKAERVRDASRRRGPTVYVGDGINDGPALAVADVGVAVANASAVAEAAAHVVLTRGGAERIPEVLNRARRAYRVMRTNLVWAVGYNVIALPFAAVGHVPPAVAAAMMVASSVFVLSNSSRLIGIGRSPAQHGAARPDRRDGALTQRFA